MGSCPAIPYSIKVSRSCKSVIIAFLEMSDNANTYQNNIVVGFPHANSVKLLLGKPLNKYQPLGNFFRLGSISVLNHCLVEFKGSKFNKNNCPMALEIFHGLKKEILLLTSRYKLKFSHIIIDKVNTKHCQSLNSTSAVTPCNGAKEEKTEVDHF